jgi:hypothetical protein
MSAYCRVCFTIKAETTFLGSLLKDHVFENTKNNKNPGGHTLTAIHLHE